MYACVKTDNMTGTIDGARLVSVKYHVGANEAPIENGNVVLVGALMEGEREVRKATAPAKTSPLSACALIAAPEVVKEKAHNGAADFINEAGVPTRGYKFVSGNIFSVTAEAITNGKSASAEIAVGDAIELQDGTKFKTVGATATSGSTVVGKVIAIEGKFFVIEVA